MDEKLISDEGYDECNALVLPSKKRETNVVYPASSSIGKVSKKQRRKLEKILEHKQKKERVSSNCKHIAYVQTLMIFN